MTARRPRTGKERLRIGALRGWECSLCHGQIDPRRDAYEIEHTIPLAMGGEDEDNNLTVVHARCHKAKTVEDLGAIAKAKRRELRFLGARRSKNPIKGWRRFNGEPVRNPRIAK